MAETFTGTLDLVVNATLSGDLDLGAGTHKVKKTYTTSLANGSGANQANNMFADQRTISASSNDDLDLAGTLTNAFGTTLTFTSIKAIIIKADSDNTNDIEIGAEGTNDFATFFGDATDKLVLKPGGTFALTNPNADGYAVTASTGDILRIANGGAGSTVTYDLVIIGEV